MFVRLGRWLQAVELQIFQFDLSTFDIKSDRAAIVFVVGQRQHDALVDRQFDITAPRDQLQLCHAGGFGVPVSGLQGFEFHHMLASRGPVGSPTAELRNSF